MLPLVGIDLVRHLAYWAKKTNTCKIEHAMISHYGRPMFTSHDLKELVRQLREHAESGNPESMQIHLHEQLALPFPCNEPIDALIAETANFRVSKSIPDC
jgi:hypothetical protein